jgi:hypothetical protein
VARAARHPGFGLVWAHFKALHEKLSSDVERRRWIGIAIRRRLSARSLAKAIDAEGADAAPLLKRYLDKYAKIFAQLRALDEGFHGALARAPAFDAEMTAEAKAGLQGFRRAKGRCVSAVDHLRRRLCADAPQPVGAPKRRGLEVIA